MTRRRLLTLGHSYVVGLNRRLAHEMARVGRDTWDVTAVAPRFIVGDLRPIRLEPIANEACRLVSLPVRCSRVPQLLHYAGRLNAMLRQPWDFIHAWLEPYTFGGLQIAWNCRSPWAFWTFQNLSKSYPPPFSWIETYCLNRCAGWVACGETVCQTLSPRGYQTKPSAVIGLGTDLEVFRPDPAARRAIHARLGWSNGPPVVGYLGRFVREKGLPLLVQALGQLRTPWRALFVGGGPLTLRLQAWATTQGERVRVVTGVPHDEVPAYINAMDLLAAPSQTAPHWREQFGRMLIEAAACGVPVVGSDSGEIPYVIADAGRVVPEADVAAWTATLGELLAEPASRKHLGQEGLERVRTHFTWPVIARKHLDFFETLAERR